MNDASPQPVSQTAKILLAALIVTHLVLGMLFSLAMQPFEKLDERSHWYFVHYVRENWSLPDQRTIQPVRLQWYQPPLYYYIAAALTSPIPDTAFLEPDENDFYLRFPLTHYPDNTNLFFHNPAEESWPPRGDIFAIFVARGLSLAFSAVAVFFTFLIARLFFRSEWLALGAASWVALTPGTLNYATTVANDPAALGIGTAMLFVICLGLIRGFTWRRAAVLGVLAGLAILSKLFVLATVAAIPLAFYLSPGWQADRRKTIGQLALVIALATAVAGWWLARNWILYGDFTGTEIAAQQYGISERPPLTWQDVENQIFVWFYRYWAHFGAVGLPRWGNIVLVIFASVLFLGVVLFFVRKWLPDVLRPDRNRLVVFLGVVMVLNLIQLITPVFAVLHGSQPRYMMTVYAVLGMIQQLGVVGWVGVKREQLAAILPSVALIPLALFSLFGVLWPAYRRPLNQSDAAIAAQIETEADVTIEGVGRLIGFGFEPDIAIPGEMVFVTVCFETGEATDQPYPYFIQFVDPNTDVKVGDRNTHPRLGLYPTHFWEAGNQFCDRVRVPVEGYAAEGAPRTYDVITGFFDLGTQEPVMVQVAGQSQPFVTLGQIAIIPQDWPEAPQNDPLVRYGNMITLDTVNLPTDASAGEIVSIDLTWEAIADVDLDYTLFVHVVDADGMLAAQFDGGPRNGLFPTRFWEQGAVVSDEIRLDLSPNLEPGTYTVLLGWYNQETGVRLPAVAGETSVPNDAFSLGQLTIP